MTKEIQEVEKTVKVAKKVVKAEAAPSFAGHYDKAMGKRKAAAVSIRIFAGTGRIIVNGKDASEYFSLAEYNLVITPLKLTGHNIIDISAIAAGGGKKGQADALRHAIAKALLKINPEWRASLKAKGWLTRDARIKERKKPGLKRARKAPQWSKR